jgi:hypothetical protein
MPSAGSSGSVSPGPIGIARLGKPAWKSRLFRGALTIAAVVSLLFVAASARASCGSFSQVGAGKQAHPASWDTRSGRAHLTEVDEPAASIVGMWHVTFTAKGNSEGPPDNTPIDNAIIVWHSDRTEVMNSGRPAQDGDFCLGVWEEVGRCHYKLNHFAWMLPWAEGGGVCDDGLTVTVTACICIKLPGLADGDGTWQRKRQCLGLDRRPLRPGQPAPQVNQDIGRRPSPHSSDFPTHEDRAGPYACCP